MPNPVLVIKTPEKTHGNTEDTRAPTGAEAI